jgi:hypothetical protein
MAPMDCDINYSNVGPWPYKETDFGRNLGEIADVFVGQSSPRGRAVRCSFLDMLLHWMLQSNATPARLK